MCRDGINLSKTENLLFLIKYIINLQLFINNSTDKSVTGNVHDLLRFFFSLLDRTLNGKSNYCSNITNILTKQPGQAHKLKFQSKIPLNGLN